MQDQIIPLGSNQDHPSCLITNATIIYDTWNKLDNQDNQAKTINSVFFFFLNATINECIRLHTHYMNEIDLTQMKHKPRWYLCNQGDKSDSIHAYAH